MVGEGGDTSPSALGISEPTCVPRPPPFQAGWKQFIPALQPPGASERGRGVSWESPCLLLQPTLRHCSGASSFFGICCRACRTHRLPDAKGALV